MPATRSLLRAALPATLLGALLLTAPLLGCTSAVQRVGMAFLYQEADHPESRTWLDVPYREDDEADPRKHRLDLFLPEPSGEPWPVLVFVHGGGWTHGDRTLRAGGADVYRNIGRYFAGEGVGVASISYRLQPEADWRDQVRDVSRAVHWVQQHAARYGGDPSAVFVSGHSAGAQLATHVALGTDRELGGDRQRPVCGVIPVSGAGLDLADAKTYEIGADPAYYATRFGGTGAGRDWRRFASPIQRVRPGAPPALVLHAEGEGPVFHRQAELLDHALREAGVASRIVVVPGESHERIVLTLSRPDKTAGPAILDFVRTTSCAS